MNYPIPNPDGAAVIEVESRVSACTECGGSVARHSLGGGQAVDRCTRCFRRYQVRGEIKLAMQKGRLRRLLDDIVGWRE